MLADRDETKWNFTRIRHSHLGYVNENISATHLNRDTGRECPKKITN